MLEYLTLAVGVLSAAFAGIAAYVSRKNSMLSYDANASDYGDYWLCSIKLSGYPNGRFFSKVIAVNCEIQFADSWRSPDVSADGWKYSLPLSMQVSKDFSRTLMLAVRPFDDFSSCKILVKDDAWFFSERIRFNVMTSTRKDCTATAHSAKNSPSEDMDFDPFAEWKEEQKSQQR